MFNIEKLILKDDIGTEFTYSFKKGINFFQGKNDSGKTEFYRFIDYMLGSSYDLVNKRWYDNLSDATLILHYDDIAYKLTRTKNININYFSYADEKNDLELNLEEYKNRIMAIFSPEENKLREMREFLDEDITYRTFTLFNFLGENGQGIIYDFFDKCRELKYSVRMTSILNFIFNNNLDAISKLKKELNILENDVNKMEKDLSNNTFVCNRINTLLVELGINKKYNAKNYTEIKKQIDLIVHMDEKPIKDKTNIAKLELLYNTLTEQIKEYDKMIQDSKQIENDNNNRILLIKKLQELVKNRSEYEYLTQPIIETLSELKNSISFSKYVRQDEIVDKLREQRLDVKKEIYRQNKKFNAYSLNEKTEKIVILKDLLSQEFKSISVEQLQKKKIRITEIKKELKLLQNQEDQKKIAEVSRVMTELYMASAEISDISETDFSNNGFSLKYLKKGNSIQAIVQDNEDKENNYYIGSMARHTLMQLCGYISFLILLLKENRYPLIPILVLDHISKQFDVNNEKAIGIILDKAYEYIDKENLQIFIFDDESSESLNIHPDHEESLVVENIKTGFMPFYK